MRAAALLVILALAITVASPAQTSDPDPMLTRTVLFEDFTDANLPCWQQDRQGGFITVVNDALQIQARTFTGHPTTTSLVLENVLVNNCFVEFELNHSNALGEAVITFKNAGASWYEVQFDVTAGQVRLEKWANRQLAHAGIFGAYALETATNYFCRLIVVENNVIAQISTDGFAWDTLFHFVDSEVTAPGTVSIVGRDRKEMIVDNLRIRAVAGTPGNPIPEMVQTAWTDDFSDEDTLAWISDANGGIAGLSNGSLALLSMPTGTTSSRVHSLRLRNFCLNATVTLKGASGSGAVDLRLDTSGTYESMYRVVLDPTVSRVRLEQHTGGVITPLGSGSFFLADNSAYDLQLVCFEGWVFVGVRGNGNTIWDYLVSHFGTTPLPAGSIRFSSSDGKELRVDDIVIRAVVRYF